MKRAITKVILLTLFIAISALAASRFELQQEFNAHKRNYLKSVLSDNRDDQISYLNKLIYVGSQLRISTIKYKNELKRINGKVETKKHRIKLQKQRKIEPVSTVSKYTITNVEQTSNSITLSFARNVTKRDMKFLERRKGSLYEDVFEFRGKYKYAKPTKLSIRGIDRILIYQSKHNTLKVIARDRSNPKTVYSINGNKIKITFLDTPKKAIKYQSTKSFGKVSSSDSRYNIKNLEQTSDRIILTFSKKVTKKDIKFSEFRQGGSYNDVFEFKGRYKYAAPAKIKISGIDRVLVSQYKYNRLRITIKNKTNPKTIYIFDGNKIIIKFLNLSKDNKQVNEPQDLYIVSKKSSYKASSKVIVIDPGHGGKDPGALGKGKRKEKIVTLSVSKKLVKILKDRGYRVYITRTRDKFISLKSRTKVANKRNADLFISVHANAAHKSRVNKAKGVETFFLSPARSERAKRVAAKENKGDMDAMNWSSKESFLTVLNQGKITASNKLAIDIHKNMLYNLKKNYKEIVDGGVREGPFWVLVGAQMPSVLIEIGYISHPVEGKRMFTSRYQNLLANGIANGIDAYFSKNE